MTLIFLHLIVVTCATTEKVQIVPMLSNEYSRNQATMYSYSNALTTSDT